MMFIYAISDRKSAFQPDLLVLPNDDVARRYFTQFVREKQATSPFIPLVSYPQDFDVICLGSFDPDTGSISCDSKHFLLSIDECLSPVTSECE